MLFLISLISGLVDGSIVVWNPLETDETKQKRILRQKHLDSVMPLSFSPDGRLLASADGKGEFIIWSTKVSNRRRTSFGNQSSCFTDLHNQRVIEYLDLGVDTPVSSLTYKEAVHKWRSRARGERGHLMTTKCMGKSDKMREKLD